MGDGLRIARHEPGAAPRFLYDFAEPDCWLAAEGAVARLGATAEWVPVRGAAVRGGAPPAPADPDGLAARAAAAGLLPVRWPAAWPWDPEPALLAATYAKAIGRVIAFSLAAFRQAYAGGRDLGDADTVLIAAAANEMHPRAVLAGMRTRATAGALERATAAAVKAGVTALPAVVAGTRAWCGPDAVDEAAAALAVAGAAP